MVHEDEWMSGRFWTSVVFRIIFALVVAAIIFELISNGLLNWTQQPPFLFSNWFWRLVGLLFLVWLLSWMFRWPWHHRHWDEGHEIRILRRRYARGEISREEFLRMKEDLEQ
jgi:uncharacterized membrane protein